MDNSGIPRGSSFSTAKSRGSQRVPVGITTGSDRDSRGYLCNTTDDAWGFPSESLLLVPVEITAGAPGIQRGTVGFQGEFRRVRGCPWEFPWVFVGYSGRPWTPVGFPAQTKTVGSVQVGRGFALVQVCHVCPHRKSRGNPSELNIVSVGLFGFPLSRRNGVRYMSPLWSRVLRKCVGYTQRWRLKESHVTPHRKMRNPR